MESNIVSVIVAFLSTTTVVGLLVYFYFRQVQNEVIPKEISNEAQIEYYTRRNRRLSNPTISSIVVSRLLILYSTFVSVVAFSVLVLGIRNGVSALHILEYVLLSIVGSPLVLLVFPIGITALIAPDAVFSRNLEGLFVGYSIYLVICSLGIFVKDRRVFTVIYLIFIVLLIMNAVGCSRICINPDGCG